MKLSDLEDAFLFVGGAALGECTAMICPQTGQVCLQSEMGDLDEIPEEAYDSDSWWDIPHKTELGLGRNLAFTFVAQRIPKDIDRVERIFSKRGAYSRFKDLLHDRGILEEWYEFENARLKEEILEWCQGEGIEVTE